MIMKIFKIIVSILLVCMCVAFCVACDNTGSTDNAGGDGSQSENNNSTVKFYVEYNGTKIELGAKADSVIEALGEPQSKNEIGNCGGLGAQVRYVYPSVEIFVLQSNTDGNIIDQITFRDDIVTTPEGVYIGMTKAEAEDALGDPTEETEKAIIYTSGKYTLKLNITDGKVTDINYYYKTSSN